MEKEELIEKYGEIEKRIVPIKDFLEKNKDCNGYKGLYKGIITLQSPLVFQPEILFIGINAGDGAYNILNPSKNETPLRMIGENEMCFNEFNWFEKGNSRGHFKITKEKKEWMSFEWYQRDQKINNSFPKRMIDLLYETAKIKFPDEYKVEKYDHNKEPFWYKNFGKSIMSTNLYPIATTNTKDLNKTLDSLAQEEELKKLWEETKGNDKDINNWTVRKYFIRRINELIRLVQPKIIVCLGKTAFNDLTYTNSKDYNGSKLYFIEKKFGDSKVPVIGFSRSGQWSGLIPEIAKEIVEKQLQ